VWGCAHERLGDSCPAVEGVEPLVAVDPDPEPPEVRQGLGLGEARGVSFDPFPNTHRSKPTLATLWSLSRIARLDAVLPESTHVLSDLPVRHGTAL